MPDRSGPLSHQRLHTPQPHHHNMVEIAVVTPALVNTIFAATAWVPVILNAPASQYCESTTDCTLDLVFGMHFYERKAA